MPLDRPSRPKLPIDSAIPLSFGAYAHRERAARSVPKLRNELSTTGENLFTG